MSRGFWLGLGSVHYLTLPSVGEWELRIDMTFANGEKHYATYSHFRVSSEADKYRLHISGFSSPALCDKMAYQNSMTFSTRDQDNDKASGSFAQRYHGAWWYSISHSLIKSHTYTGTSSLPAIVLSVRLQHQNSLLAYLNSLTIVSAVLYDV